MPTTIEATFSSGGYHRKGVQRLHLRLVRSAAPNGMRQDVFAQAEHTNMEISQPNGPRFGDAVVDAELLIPFADLAEFVHAVEAISERKAE